MRRSTRFTMVSRVLAMLALVFAAHIAVAAPATAAPSGSCYGYGCVGLDPQAAGCSDSSSYTLDSFTYGGAFVELRHGYNCGAYWVRVTPPGDSVTRSVMVDSSNGNDYGVSAVCHPDGIPNNCDASWTRMTVGVEIRGCLNNWGPPCTRWHLTGWN